MFTGFEEKNQERVKLVDVDPANVQTLLPAANLLKIETCAKKLLV